MTIPFTPKPNDWGDRILSFALPWEGQEFNADIPEQCCAFVRHVLAKAGNPLATKVTTAALDGHWTGPDLASSLCGYDIGTKIGKNERFEAGDLVFWNDTYYTGFPKDTITHIGIAIDNDRFIHRNTMAGPVNVQRFDTWNPSLLRCAIRLPQDIKPSSTPITPPPADIITGRMWANDRGQVVDVRQLVPPGSYQVFSAGGNSDGSWLVKLKRKEVK